ncbi:hypothetical protein DMN91_005725 [Ooceraea biroi]|uniref:Odorant receptor n=1 Tax=Ooceraea biroi TaxID=2015173 RepID=A0A3L8DME5_OOCBI|nr:uncharacterized protein LOC105285845 [Ooceraea biroi]RLU21352.1 hypothetical protein DMN91_005725 [Ooceraea biroi]
MICIQTQDFNINRILLLLIGLWPYQRSKMVHFQVILFFGIMACSVILQITIFITIECTTDILISIVSTTLYVLAYMIIYISFWINMHTVRYLLEQLQCICNELKDANEITIIKKYGNKTKCQTIMLLSITLCGLLIFISLTIWPRIIDIDIVLLINDSQPCHARHAIITEYFLDEERYFYLVLLQMYVTFFIGGFTMTATGTMLLGYIKYICGMFKIASYRIEHAMMINMLENIKVKEEIGINKRIIYGIQIHSKAMKFSKFLISSFEGMFLASICIAILVLSLNLFGMFRYVLVKDAGKSVLHSIMVVLLLVLMFLANSASQDIIDYNNDVFSAACNIQWYVAPLRTQKLILFLLQRGNTIFNLRIAGVFTGSFECFATMTKQAISYFTVIYSTQQ